MGPSCLLGITNFDPAHEKHCVERTYKFRKFCIMSVMKSQKAAENSQNRKTNDHRGFIVLQTQLASFESRNYQVILDSY